jgi:acetyltransferase-like isoleucine patch superfamily enzyme
MWIKDAIVGGLVQVEYGAQIDDAVSIIALEDDRTSAGIIVIGEGTIVRSGTVLCSGVSIGKKSIVGHNCVLRARARIGSETVVSHLVNIERDVVIGSGTRISAQTHLTGACVIEDNCHIGANVGTINDRNLERRASLHAPIFREGARIGTGCTIMAGVVIGRRALIGAASLVLSSIPDDATAYGVPAIIRGYHG